MRNLSRVNQYKSWLKILDLYKYKKRNKINARQ